MSGVASRRASPGLALAAAAAFLCVPAAGAQQPRDDGAGGGIITERLEPLMPGGVIQGEGIVPRDERFQQAPFIAPESSMVPELIAPVDTVAQAGARLRQLDKMTGQAETVEIAAGEEVVIDRLRVRLEACRAPEGNGEHGTMAFLRVWDAKAGDAGPVFSGWMFAESPALSAMDHPRYDLWVMSCITDSGEGSSASR
ncbi:MAG TPA: DUF2155 domain-containing protein [Thermohalobaculum sp.]|nr:DUF2155 domain-containing protein [Thermohalobaculum sp.]